MKFWDTFKEDDKKYPWWIWIFFVIGLLIGIGIAALIVGALFLFLGWVFSFLWNYSIAPTFSVTEITTTVASGLLFFIFCGARLIKFLVKSQLLWSSGYDSALSRQQREFDPLHPIQKIFPNMNLNFFK